METTYWKSQGNLLVRKCGNHAMVYVRCCEIWEIGMHLEQSGLCKDV